MLPQDADQVTSVVAENCSASFTTTMGFVGLIVNPELEALEPESATVWGLPVALSVNTRFAEKPPDAAGLNVTLAVQLAATARLVPQVLLAIAKLDAFAPEIAALLIVTAVFVPFVIVTVCGELVTPSAVFPNETLDGVTVRVPPADEAPVPDNAAVCGLLLELSETVNVAARVPATVGLNATVTVQLAAAARLVPQVLLAIEKSPGFVPVMAMLLMVIDVVPAFFRVVVCDALVDPMFTVPNASEVGDNATVPLVLVPVPESVIFCGLPLPESVKFKVAVRVPVVVGAKMMFAVQLADPARLVPHVLLNI